MTSHNWFRAAGAAFERQRAALVAGDAAALTRANDALIRLLGCPPREPGEAGILREQIRVQASLAENGLAATTRLLQAMAGAAPGALLSGVG